MEGEEERGSVGEENSQKDDATDETSRGRQSVHKLLSFDQIEGVMMTMTRRTNVKNKQVGVCGDMHACHNQCTVTIPNREERGWAITISWVIFWKQTS